MAVMVYCSNPGALLTEIKAAMSRGEIVTWQIDAAGDLTHAPEQWRNLAWFRPSVEADNLTFNIIGRRSKTMTKATYAVYHGRLIEMLLTHFDTKFTIARATAQVVVGDSLWVPQKQAKPSVG